MATRRVFGLVRGDRIVAVGDDLNEVVSHASGPVLVMDGAEINDGAPDDVQDDKAAVLNQMGLPRVNRALFERYLNNPQEAYTLLKAIGIKAANAGTMSRSFLKSNAKMAKEAEEKPYTKTPAQSFRDSKARARKALKRQGKDGAVCKGVVLLPYDFANHPTVPGMDRKLPMSSPKGLCPGSSPACRDSCLAFAGKNTAYQEQVSADGQTTDKISNLVPKALYTVALFKQPEAFLAMLKISIDKHAAYCRKKNVQAFVRLNVLSDIPWEAWVKWFFEDYIPEDVILYDYTKIGWRKPLANYDLTLSFSGKNETACKRRLADGGRVAVVFVHKKSTGEMPADRAYVHPIPETFWGYPTVDGDATDFRPLDPGGHVVMLRWKVFMGHNMTFDSGPLQGQKKDNKAVLGASVGAKFVSTFARNPAPEMVYPWYLDEASGVIYAIETPGNNAYTYVADEPTPE